jgi:hypothetical protein
MARLASLLPPESITCTSLSVRHSGGCMTPPPRTRPWRASRACGGRECRHANTKFEDAASPCTGLHSTASRFPYCCSSAQQLQNLTSARIDFDFADIHHASFPTSAGPCPPAANVSHQTKALLSPNLPLSSRGPRPFEWAGCDNQEGCLNRRLTCCGTGGSTMGRRLSSLRLDNSRCTFLHSLRTRF